MLCAAACSAPRRTSSSRLTLTQLIQQAEQVLARREARPARLGRRVAHASPSPSELREERLLVHLIFNAYWEPLEFELPRNAGDRPLAWRRWIDTALASPQDIVPWQSAQPVESLKYPAQARSVVVLVADVPPAKGG